MTPEEVERHLESKPHYLDMTSEMFTTDPSLDIDRSDLIHGCQTLLHQQAYSVGLETMFEGRQFESELWL